MCSDKKKMRAAVMRHRIRYVTVILASVAVLFMTKGLPCYAQEIEDRGYCVIVEDDANLLTREQEEALGATMADITAYGNVAFKSIEQNALSAESFAEYYYQELFGTDSGTLFLIDMDNRMIYLHSDGAVYKVITKDYANTITDNVYRYASGEDYYSCAAKAYEQIFALLEGERIAQSMKHISNALLAISLALLINFGIIVSTTKIRRPGHDEVLKHAEVYFSCTSPKAEFTHRTKTYDPVSSDSGGSYSGGSSSSSSGGGGGSSGGGGGHRF